jgi:hypothetical protein
LGRCLAKVKRHGPAQLPHVSYWISKLPIPTRFPGLEGSDFFDFQNGPWPADPSHVLDLNRRRLLHVAPTLCLNTGSNSEIQLGPNTHQVKTVSLIGFVPILNELL